MKISSASRASGLSADAIRFYERRGVVPAPGRLVNGYRDYTERHVLALRFARGLRDIGVPLAEVAAMVRLAHDGTCGDLRGAMAPALAEALEKLDERIRTLRITRRELRTLRAGLANMNPRRASIPGITPCECVELVARSKRSTPRGPVR